MKTTLLLIILFGAIISNSQPVTILDSTIVLDKKASYFDSHVKQIQKNIIKYISEEGAANDTIRFYDEFINALNTLNYVNATLQDLYIQTKDIEVNSKDIKQEIKDIEDWQSKILADEKIKNKTSIGAWIIKAERLAKLKEIEKKLK